MKETRTITCKTCYFFEPMGTDEDTCMGFCHRYPPVFCFSKSTMQGLDEFERLAVNSEGYQPKVSHDDWCGEYRAAPPE